MFIKHSRIGRAIRAASEDYLCIQLFGVDYRKIYAITYGLSLVVAAVSGFFWGLIFTFTPSSGWNYLMFAFAALVLGGMGTMRGPVVAGVIFGIIQTLSSYYLGMTYQYLIVCLIILVIIAIRPEGIFKRV
jgi:branched-chain amino acid transport system permease protein